MHVLITGGAGYIGSHVVLALREAGYQPVILDDLSTGSRALVPSDLPFIEGSCGDEALLDRVFSDYAMHAVIHLAGSVVVPESVENPLKYYENNTVNGTRLLAACVRHRLRYFVFSSTAAVYGMAGGMAEDMAVSESHSLAPVNPYGHSKAMLEQQLSDVGHAHGLHHIALRYFNVAGADPAGRAGQISKDATHLIKVASEVALGLRDTLSIYGTDYPTADGTCVRDYIHVSDLAQIHVHALSYLEDGGSSTRLNCGYGRGYSVKEIVDAMGVVLGRPLPHVFAPRRAGDPPILIAKIDEMQRVLGFRPRYDLLETILESALAWEKRRL